MIIKQPLVLIIGSLFFLSNSVICQKGYTDTVAFKREFEQLLKKYKIDGKGYSINVTSENQKGGQTAFIITNKYYDSHSAQRLINIKFKSIDSLKNKKMAEQISNLNSTNTFFVCQSALNYVQQNKEQLVSELQYNQLIQAFRNTFSDIQRGLLPIIAQSNFSVVNTFLKELASDSTTGYEFKTIAIKHLFSIKQKQDLEFCFAYLKPRDAGSSFRLTTLTELLSKFDKELLLQLLNSKEPTELCFNDGQFYYQSLFENYREEIRRTINGSLSNDIINSTYFFSFRPTWIKWYDTDFKRLSDWYHPQ